MTWLLFQSGEQVWRQREKGRDVGLGRGEEAAHGGEEGRPGSSVGRKLLEGVERTECGAGGRFEAGEVPPCWTAAAPGVHSASGAPCLGFVVGKLDPVSGFGVARSLLVSQLRATRSGFGAKTPEDGPCTEAFGSGRFEMPPEGLQFLVKNLWLELEQVEPPGLQLKDELAKGRKGEWGSGGKKRQAGRIGQQGSLVQPWVGKQWE